MEETKAKYKLTRSEAIAVWASVFGVQPPLMKFSDLCIEAYDALGDKEFKRRLINVRNGKDAVTGK